MNGSFITLAVSQADGVIVHGVFGSRLDARLSEDWFAMNRSDVLVSRTVALFPPDAEPLRTRTTTGGEVFEMPDEAMSALENHTREATARDECVIALVVVPDESRVAFAVGPFSNEQAHQWRTDAASPHGSRSLVCCLLPVRARNWVMPAHPRRPRMQGYCLWSWSTPRKERSALDRSTARRTPLCTGTTSPAVWS